jgi:DNA-binding transcriptional regulator YhcF (GntR family)
MNRMSTEPQVVDVEMLHERIRTLGRDALEGTRPLSDLFGAALSELRGALESVRALRAELERERANGHSNGVGGGARITEPSSPSPEVSPRLRVELFDRPVPRGAPALEESLRARISGAHYLGLLDDGDRLPSVRELTRRTGLNHKVVRRVYRALERGGFVEVRDRSGIYASGPDAGAVRAMGPDAAWVAGIVAEAVEQGVAVVDLPRLLERAVSQRALRCACVDSTEDDRFGLCREIGGRFGVQTVPVDIESGRPTEDAGGFDLAVTTPFHADEVRKWLGPGKPLVVVRLHPEWWQMVARHEGEEPLGLVCVDRAAGDRFRHALGPDLAQRVRVVTLDGTPAKRNGHVDGGRCVATGAAAARLEGRPPGIMVPPYLSSVTIARLAQILVVLNHAAPTGPTSQ